MMTKLDLCSRLSLFNLPTGSPFLNITPNKKPFFEMSINGETDDINTFQKCINSKLIILIIMSTFTQICRAELLSIIKYKGLYTMYSHRKHSNIPFHTPPTNISHTILSLYH